MAAAELPALINSLPRLLTEHLTVIVTGTAAIDYLWLKGFYGSGSLTVQAAEDAEITVQVTARAEYCSVPITFDGLKIIGNGSMSGSILSAGHGSFLTVRNCEIDREHDSGKSGAAVTDASRLFLDHCRITHCDPALNCWDASILSAVDCVGQNNNHGIYAQGGIVLLRGTTPDLMGGAANSKGGGLIVRGDGTLL